MCDGRFVLALLAAATVLIPCASCGGAGSRYAGRWECASGGGDFFEIKENEGAFLVTDESGATFPASLDDKKTLTLSGVPMMGSLPLPIDAETGELICSVCSCHRYAKVEEAGSRDAQAVRPQIDDGEAQKQTLADIRNMGTAMFSWLTDQVSASAAGQTQQVDLVNYKASSHAEVEQLLVPQYLQTLPERDGWGHAYEFYLNIANPLAPKVMGIRSPGRDGRFSATAYSVAPFAAGDFDEDLVWVDGFFVRWPGQ